MKRKLTDTAAKNAKPTPDGKPKKYSDGCGLLLLVNPNGLKYWRYVYRMDGKQKTLSIGSYPEISLKDARLLHEEARALLARGIDPSQHKQAAKNERLVKTTQRPSFSPKSKEYEDMINDFIVIGAMATTGCDAEEAARLLGVTVEFINERF